jgi:hypothetical protein
MAFCVGLSQRAAGTPYGIRLSTLGTRTFPTFSFDVRIGVGGRRPGPALDLLNLLCKSSAVGADRTEVCKVANLVRLPSLLVPATHVYRERKVLLIAINHDFLCTSLRRI